MFGKKGRSPIVTPDPTPQPVTPDPWIRKPSGDTCVIFVHGVLSSGNSAWLNTTNNKFWPDLLSLEPGLDHLGIYNFTYRADLLSGDYGPQDAANLLTEHLSREQLWKKGRLIFVCHSMGGLVARRCLVGREAKLMADNPDIEIGVFLVASPSLGSEHASWIDYILALGEITIAHAEALKKNNQWLNALHDDFKNLVGGQRIAVDGRELVEDEATLPEILPEWLKAWVKKQLVEPSSGAAYFLEPIKVARTDHSSIAKPEDTSAEQHQILVNFIKTMLPARREKAMAFLHSLQDVLKGEEKRYQAFTATAQALDATVAYLKDQRQGQERCDERESTLSDLWADAQRRMRDQHYRRLAGLCQVEGGAWAEDRAWTERQNIALLQKVSDKVDKVLHPDASRDKRDIESLLCVDSFAPQDIRYGIFIPTLQYGGPPFKAHSGKNLESPFKDETCALADVYALRAISILLAKITSYDKIELMPRPDTKMQTPQYSHWFLIGGPSNPLSNNWLTDENSPFRFNCKEKDDKWWIKDVDNNSYEVINPWIRHEEYKDKDEDYGIIWKFRRKKRVYFIMAGLGSFATQYCANYLESSWKQLFNDFRSENFAILLKYKGGHVECIRS